MPEEYRNIYKICRKSAGFTQEAAAERLGISVESLRAYETGQRVPPDEVVETMPPVQCLLPDCAACARAKCHVQPGSTGGASVLRAGGVG